MSIKKIEEKASFLTILTKLFVNKHLSKLDVFVYATISYYLNLNEYCSRTCRELAEEVTASKSAVAASIARLVEHGYLAKILQEGSKSKYLLVLPNSQMVIQTKKLSTKSPRKLKNCPLGRTKLSARPDKTIRSAGQDGTHTLYTKELFNKQTTNKDVVCLFNLFDLEKFGFTQELVNEVLAESKKATKESIQKSLEYFDYIMNKTNHKNKNPIGVFRSAINKKGFIDAPFSFKVNPEMDKKAEQEEIHNQTNKQNIEKENQAFQQWRKKLDLNYSLQEEIIKPIENQLQMYNHVPAGKMIIKQMKELKYKNYFLENVYCRN